MQVKLPKRAVEFHCLNLVSYVSLNLWKFHFFSVSWLLHPFIEIQNLISSHETDFSWDVESQWGFFPNWEYLHEMWGTSTERNKNNNIHF